MADNKDLLICPACGEFMEKIHIKDANLHLDICTEGCGGIWFDNREELKFDEQHESIDEIKKILYGRAYTKVDQTKDRYCPVCAVKMVKNFCSVKREIEVDECYTCGGKFFDHGELEAMRAQYRTEAERVAAVKALGEKMFGGELKRQEYQLNQIKRTGIINGLKRLFFN